MVCPKCKNTIDADSKFCPYCGEKIESSSKNLNSHKLLICLCMAVIALCSTAGIYFVKYTSCCKLADSGAFTAANMKYNPAIMSLHDKQLGDYINAGVALENHEYKEAGKQFKELGNYRNAQQFALDAKAGLAVEYAATDSTVFMHQAVGFVDDLSENNYSDAEQVREKVYSSVFNFAKSYYEQNDFLSAKTRFVFLGSHNDSDKYFNLCDFVEGKARLIGAAPTAVEIKLYRTVVQNIQFANTKEILVKNNYAAGMFISGRWKTETGNNFLELTDDGMIRTNLPVPANCSKIKNDTDDFQFIGGNLVVTHLPVTEEEARIAIKNGETPGDKSVMSITVIDENTIKVHNVHDNKNYILLRQK